MNGLRRSTWVVLAGLSLVAAVPGCKSGGFTRSASAEPGMAAASPTLGAPVEPNGTVVSTTPGASVAWYDHHPLFSRPKHYYDTTQSNRFVKAGVATVVGIPAGFYSEIKQIVTGVPVEPRY